MFPVLFQRSVFKRWYCEKYLKANPGPIFQLNKCHAETLRLQRIDNGPLTEVGNIVYLTVQHRK